MAWNLLHNAVIVLRGVIEANTPTEPSPFTLWTLRSRAGEICVLVGPSGCGKTTTMRMINRLVEPTAGTILAQRPGRPRHGRAARCAGQIGYVIQAVGLFPHQTVRRNVATVPFLLGWDKHRIRGAQSTSCWPWSASTRTSTGTATRTSCPEGSGSGSGSHGRWPRTRRCC